MSGKISGSGRTEIAETIFGRRAPLSGEIVFDGKPVRNQADAIDRGIALVPEDRRKMGLVLDHSVRDNVLPTLVPREVETPKRRVRKESA